ncbi:hypothetical protein IFT48_04000 [Pseudomonas fluorescens]|uniref:hypothetical protein n=2 Tax=Pseudomonas TaxID=286 RepID=UPI001930D42C|nr:hypothetical protein [Pseudomonas fluorescens]MBD8089134.1 hypothetical protein [Pseudomonas fluorescens]
MKSFFYLCALLVLSLTNTTQAESGLMHSTYAWHSQTLLNPKSSQEELTTLSQYGISRIYLGLSAAQLQTPSQTGYALNNLIKRAHIQGIAVDLLLGDPDWIAPEHQGKLLSIINGLKDIPFDGMMLDIEIEQSQVPAEQRVALWAQTVELAIQNSPWLVTSASHWRWYSKSPAVCEQNKSLSSASLMIYSTNVEVIRRRALEAQAVCPDAQISVSQSVESILSSQESWAGAAGFDEVRGRLEKALAGTGVKSIDWQDWDSLKKIPPRAAR